MTRENDRKRNESKTNPRLDDYDQKVEDRFDKEVRAKQQQGGAQTGTPPKLGKSHADDGGEHRF